jgi:hypothetical protein
MTEEIFDNSRKLNQVARPGWWFLAQASAAAMRLEMGGWEWKSSSTSREGWLSLRFCLPSFSMAVM